jgi:transcriptional regulator with XRE-family HTH domain
MASLCKRFGVVLKAERRRMAYTQLQFAERLNLTPNFVAHLERGTRKPSLDTLLTISTLLEIPIEKLLTSEPAPQSAFPENPLVRRLRRLTRGLPNAHIKLLVELAEAMHRSAT